MRGEAKIRHGEKRAAADDRSAAWGASPLGGTMPFRTEPTGRAKIAWGVSPRKPRAQNFLKSPRRGRHIGVSPSGSSPHAPGHDIRGYTNVVLRFIGLLTRCAARWRGLGDNWGSRFLGFRWHFTPGYSLSPASQALCGMKFCPVGFPGVPLRFTPGCSLLPSSRALCGMGFGLHVGSPLHSGLLSVACVFEVFSGP